VSGGEEHPDLVASWKAERGWFRWTAALATFLVAVVLGWLATRYWVFLKDQQINSAFARLFSTMQSSRIDPEALGEAGSRIETLKASASPIRFLGTTLGILSILLGVGLTTTMVKWLQAIRRRRKMEVRVGFQPGENR
jgi:hypothetical protein